VKADVVVPGVAPEEAWAWWTDFREGGEDHAFAAWAHPERRVERREDGTVVLTETARVWRFRFLEVAELELKKPRVKFQVRNNLGRFWGTYRFLPAAGGTRLEGVWDQELVRWLRWLGPLGRWAVRWFFAWDLRKHAEELAQDVAAATKAEPRRAPS
jgi:hypothetical protein